MSQTQDLKQTPDGVGLQPAARRWRRGAIALAVVALAPVAAWAQDAAAPVSPPEASPAPVPTATPTPTLTPTPARAKSGAAAKPPARPASVPTLAPEPTPVVENSYLDGQLLYQLLLAEFALREGEPADAVELMLEAARHNRDDALFRRALQIAVEAGAGDKALSIAKSWRQTLPKSSEAVRTEVQLLLALDRVPETIEPLQQLLAAGTPEERSALIASLPRAAQRAQDKTAAAAQFHALLLPYLDLPDTRVSARVALGRMDFAQGKPGAALDFAAQAAALDPKALPPVLLALDVMNAASDGSGTRTPAGTPASAAAPGAGAAPSPAPPVADIVAKAEAIIRSYLDTPEAEPLVRQAYASVLAGQQRLTDAAEQLRLATLARPTQAQLWLGLGEVELELHDPAAAEPALKQALAIVTAAQAEQLAIANASTPTIDDDAGDTLDAANPPAEVGATSNPVRLAHIELLLARAAEQRHDDAEAARWLAQVDAKDADLQVVSMRAALLARQGKLADALTMIRSAPATTPAERRYKLLTEVQLLLDEKKLPQARDVLNRANREMPDDVDLIYQEAMVDERLNQLDDMETLLRRILVLQPDNSQALNALGYSLADRNLRLDEALGLVKQAHDLSPTDPFIVDSLGWVQYRMGHFGEATTLLTQAYTSRKDTEIAAHLGEALWAEGKREEAARVLRDAHRLDAGNEVLKQTMARLKVAP